MAINLLTPILPDQVILPMAINLSTPVFQVIVILPSVVVPGIISPQDPTISLSDPTRTSHLLPDPINSISETGYMEVEGILVSERIIRATSSTSPEPVHSLASVSRPEHLMVMFSPLMHQVMPVGK